MTPSNSPISLTYHTALRLVLSILGGHLSSSAKRYVYRTVLEAFRAGHYPKLGTTRDVDHLELILHSLVVAHDELHLDAESLTAHLLYIPYRHGILSPRELSEHCGDGVVRLLGLMNHTATLYSHRASVSDENFHALLLSMAEDIRVVLLIIADRLYRLRHAKHIYSSEDCLSLAVEVSFLYAPIAHRLGLYQVKGEMEDLCLKWRDRRQFDYIVRKLGESKDSREAYIQAFIAPIQEKLRVCLDVPFEVKGRMKSISSINNKLRKQSFENIYDLFAIRIIVDCPLERERQLCWQIYSIVGDMYQPNPERLKDWISIPKANGYESLHATVMGPESRWVEVQIRSKRMDAVAERGVAAHWRYKGIRGSEGGLDEFLASVRETLEAVRMHEDSDRKALLQRSMVTLKGEQIYVFTPKGEVMKLPKGATLLDFAFAIHTRIGAQAISGKVNGRNVSLRHQLMNGDAVEVITSSQQSPKQDWLNIVVSSKAKASIRQVLRSEEEAGLEIAKELVQRRLKNRKLPFNESLFVRLTIKRGYKTLSDFYRDIMNERLDAGDFIEGYEAELRQIDAVDADRVQNPVQPRSAEEFVDVEEDRSKELLSRVNGGEVLVIEEGLSGVVYSFGKCCQPVYGDEVFGFISGRGIKIHRTDCPNAPDMIERTGHRVLSARWSGLEAKGARLVQINVVGRDDIAIVTHIVSLIKREPTSVLRNYSIDSGDGLFRGSFMIYLEQGGSVSALLKKIRGVVGVKQVVRIDG